MEERLAGAIVFLPVEAGGERLMLEPVCFESPARWAAISLRHVGVERFLVVGREEDREEALPCFPANAGWISVGEEGAQEKLETFLEHTQGRVAVLTKPVLFFRQGAERMAAQPPRRRGPAASGAYRADAGKLLAGLRLGANLKDALEELGESLDECGVQPLRPDASSRAAAQQAGREATAEWWMEHAVTVLDPTAVYIAPTVELEPGTTLLPGVILRGATRIGAGCEIGPNTMLRDVTVGEGTAVNASQCNECTIGAHTTVGPFAYIRPNTHVGDRVKVGDFVELKNSTVGDGTKISHLTYVGDSDVGEGINFGCGTVTVNYDGEKKFRTVIGDGAFIGCNTNLVAPVRVGRGAYIAAGSTITRDVPADSLAIARSFQTVKNNWAKKRRDKDPSGDGK